MTKDRDDLFERLEELFDEFDMDDRLEEIEEKVEELQEQRGDGQNPFDGPFGGPFGGNEPFGGNGGPFGGDGGPFGGENPFQSGQSDEGEGSGYGLMSDVVEEGDELVVLVDLPEFSEDQVDLTADAERVRVEAEATEDMYHDSVSQVLELPVEVQPDRAEANFENGFLQVRFPRVEPDDQTTITIE